MGMFEGLKFRKIASPMHNLDPRVKFFYVIAMFVVAVIYMELIPLIILFLVQVPLVAIAKVTRQWIKSMRGAVFLASIIFFTNFIFSYLYPAEEQTLSQILEHSTAMTLRFVVLIESFSIFFLTTSPDHLGLALEKSRVPYEFCFAFTTAVRFVPVLAEEAQTIMDAQKARGLELEKGNFLKRVKNYIPILIPLIVNAIRRSLELAEAMESRAWGATKDRTNLYELKLQKGDYTLILITILMLALAIYTRLSMHIPTITEIIS